MPTGTATLLQDANFRRLWISEAISLFGDRLLMVALPWLVLQTTNHVGAVGTVLALVSLPQTIFIFLGGALADRLSPYRMVIITNVARCVLLLSMLPALATGTVTTGLIYAFSILFGIAEAFFFPAMNALLTQVVEKPQLRPANMVMGGTAQVATIAGPVAAGLTIQLMSGHSSPGTAIAVLFLADAVTFVASLILLLRMSDRGQWSRRPVRTEALLPLMNEGFALLWKNASLRWLFLVVCMVTFFGTGPIFVGVPALAVYRLSDSPAGSYGILLAAYGAGTLFGAASGGLLRPLPPRRLGTSIMAILCILGLGLVSIGLAQTTFVCAVILVVMGCANGYATIVLVTLLQTRTHDEILGRTMAIISFALIGTTPLSNLATGMLIGSDPATLFVVAGAGVVIVSTIAAFMPVVRCIGLEPDEGGLALGR